jgi:hypothetical protein
MRYYEIIAEVKPVKPLSPKQARARAARTKKAQDSFNDVKIMNNLRVKKAKRHLTEI